VKGKTLRTLRALSKAVTMVIHSTNHSTLSRNAAATAITIAMSGTLFAQSIEEVSITGSRIQRPGLTSQTPVTSISRDEIDVLSTLRLGDALDALPQFLGSALLQDTQNMFGGGYLGNSGQSNLNLRGVGGSRTLVLLNGRRFVPSNRYGQVDISLFPSQLIQRTEVVTGGASAAYGSDAITGVTNFILNNEFEGFDMNLQYGVSELGDAKNYKLSMAGGVAVGERGNFVWGLEGFKSDEITDISGRDWYKSWGDIDYGPAVTPRRVRYENTVTRAETFGGLIRRGPLAGTQFMSDGTAAPFQDGQNLSLAALTGKNIGVVQGVQVGGSGDQVDRVDMQRAANERSSIYLNYQHKFTDTLTGSLQALHGRNTVDNQKIGYVLSGTWPVTIFSGNPYLPPDVQARMTAGNIASFQMDKRVPATDPLNNNRAPMETEVLSLSAGLAGEFSNGWNWSFYIQRAENERNVDLYGFRVDRLFKGVDAVIDPRTGAITCASTLKEPNDGCIPVNLFGVGNTTQQARDWVHDSMYTDATYIQDASEFVVNGEVFDGFGAGSVYMAGGLNWRSDRVDQLSADAFGPLPEAGQGYITNRDANGNLLYRGLPSVYIASVPVIDRVNAATYKGKIDVWEAFTEANIPLLLDAPFAQSLSTNVATRYTKYSTIEAVWAWKGGVDWQIYDELRLRLTRSRDIRAGNMTELFDTTALNAFIDDPWRPDDDIYIAKNISGGNPNVLPEKADTLTYGFVFQPKWFEGSALSLDYYDIKIKDAISTIGVNNIVNFCFDENLFCNQISYEPSGRISAVDNTTINVGLARTRGVDLETSYRTGINWFGRDDNLSLRLIGSRLISSTITPFNSPTLEQAGAGIRQKTHVTFTATYMTGPVTASWSTRWVSSAVRNVSWVSGIDIYNNNIPSHHVSNLRLNYNMDALGTNGSVYLAVSNVFNKHQGHLQMLPGIFDQVGRNYNVGFNYRM